MLFWNRTYEAAYNVRTSEREAFRSRHPQRKGRRTEPYPNDLKELPKFASWVRSEVQRAVAAGEHVVEEVKAMACPLNLLATSYRGMYAFGNHLQVASAKVGLTTSDSGVVGTFRQPCRYGLCDRRPIVANLEYIGNLEEIIEFNYRGYCTVVLLCSWVRENYRGEHATMKKDKYGFTIANFAKKILIGPESFAFPMHIDQVFFRRTHKTQVGRLFHKKKCIHRR